METTHWYSKAYFYIVEVGELRKFGVTRNWYCRERYFLKLFPNKQVNLYFIDPFDHFWQADLVEGVMRKRLERWVYLKTKEWVINDLPIISIKDCYIQVKSFLEQEYEIHEHLHWEDQIRYARYDQLYHVIKSELNEAPLNPLVEKYRK